MKTATVGMNPSTSVYSRAGARALGRPARFLVPVKQAHLSADQMKALAYMELHPPRKDGE